MSEAARGCLPASEMLSKAIAEAGLDDFGDARFVDDYRRTIDALNDEVDFSANGIAFAGAFVHSLLVNRLRMERDLKVHPEIHDEVLAPPIVVTGFPRTGTTKLQRMLSASPRCQSLAFWRLLNPAPFGPLDGGPDPRIAVGEQASNFVKTTYPDVWAPHPFPAHDSEEDFMLHDLTFRAPTIPMRFGAFRLQNALSPIDSGVYDFLRTGLKYLQWQDGSPDRATRPWVLKTPLHIGNIALLQKTFPGAKVVHSHRDVVLSMTSLSSHLELGFHLYTDTVDRHALGAGNVSFWSREWERNIEQRLQLDPGSYCDVSFADVNDNAMKVIEKIHAFAGIELDDTARNAMLRWEAGNQRHQHGRHVYKPEDYGLSVDAVRKAFVTYVGEFANRGLLTGR